MHALLATLFVLAQSSTAVCAAQSERPLFECDERLSITLELPMRTLVRDAEKKPLVDGRLYYAAPDGQRVSLDVEVTTRGRSRLVICSFPPLSVRFHPAQVEGTLFAGQGKLKIVTQCKRGSRYLEYLRQEYGLYRAFRELTDVSFRVRLLDITFVDSDGRNADDHQEAFFIESVHEVAARANLREVRQNRIDPARLDGRHANVFELFQFMIGNTDWSIRKGPGEEDCCHNGKVFAADGAETGWFVVPYDFDQAGLINTPYALPHKELPIRSVRQRLYRGRCEYTAYVAENVARFNERRDAIRTALESAGLSERTERRQDEYIAGFFDIINSPRELDRQVVERCRGKSAP